MLPSLGYRLDLSLFSELKTDDTWSFSELTQKNTNYLTHCYHRYPAKFIPQLARRIILENSSGDDTVLDPFCGSGSAVLEALLLDRGAYGSDINPLAYLITKAKTTPIQPAKLEKEIDYLSRRVKSKKASATDLPQGIFLWFNEKAIHELNGLLEAINAVEDDDVKTFLLCGFSHVLKGCSYWNMHSIKPHRDPEKLASPPPKPLEQFRRHIAKMMARNRELCRAVIDQEFDGRRRIEIADAKKLPVADESVSLVVTSPPYVTSYEYADIHQLTLMWLGKLFSTTQFRKIFIGSMSRKGMQSQPMSYLAYDVISNLSSKDEALGRSVAAYFSDMQDCFEEMVRVLQESGRVAIVIGNTTLRGVQILNAQIFVEMLVNLGLSLRKVIQREVPSKFLPSTRDPSTGKFVSSSSLGKVLAYPHEYILIFEN